MNTFAKIALRNILRNKRRSLITISAVGIGLGALIFIWSFVEGAHRQMITNYTSYITSPVQVQPAGYQTNPKLERALDNSAALDARIRQNPTVRATSPRIRAEGLIASSEASVGTVILGVHPSREILVSTLNKRIAKGTFLQDGDDQQIIIGKDMATNLNVGLEDKVVFMSQAADGSIASGAYYVKGIVDSGVTEIDKGLAIITFTAADELFVMDGRPSQIAVQLHAVEESTQTAAGLRTALNDPELEVLAWNTVSPILQQWLDYDNTFIWIIVVIVMIVVAIGIMNTVLMGVLERTREFGILLALGTKEGQIIAMVGWESVFLGLIGTAAGLFLGLTSSLYFQETGVDLTIFTDALNAFYMEPVIRPCLNFQYTFLSGVMVLATSVIVSIYPAWTAAKLVPVKAIRSI